MTEFLFAASTGTMTLQNRVPSGPLSTPNVCACLGIVEGLAAHIWMVHLPTLIMARPGCCWLDLARRHKGSANMMRCVSRYVEERCFLARLGRAKYKQGSGKSHVLFELIARPICKHSLYSTPGTVACRGVGSRFPEGRAPSDRLSGIVQPIRSRVVKLWRRSSCSRRP